MYTGLTGGVTFPAARDTRMAATPAAELTRPTSTTAS